MNAISGTRRAMKEMADGTIRVQIDIDPACRAEFLRLFPNIDMPVALAPLRADFDQAPGKPSENAYKPKGGDLAKLAGQFCQSSAFQRFVSEVTGRPDVGEEQAAQWLRNQCEIESRAELDHVPHSALMFHEQVRKPFLAWKEGRG